MLAPERVLHRVARAVPMKGQQRQYPAAFGSWGNAEEALDYQPPGLSCSYTTRDEAAVRFGLLSSQICHRSLRDRMVPVRQTQKSG